MAFVNPMLLGVGVALIGLPILLHLIMQQKPKDLVFPALRFVQERLATNQRRLRVRHWVLLFLRCLGLFLLGLAFAMPSVASNLFGTWLTMGLLGLFSLLTLFVLIATVILTRPINRLLFGVNAAIFAALLASLIMVYSNSLSGQPGIQLGNDQSPVAAVLLIDNSPRMTYTAARLNDAGQAVTRSQLDEAKILADWLIRELPDDSEVAISDSSATEPFFSVDIAAAAKRISAIQPGTEIVSLVDRLNSILDFFDALEQDQPKPQEIYIFTDRTKSSWTYKSQQRLMTRLESMSELSIYIVDLSLKEPTNYQLGDLELTAETIADGGTINLVTRLHRLGPAGERPVTLFLDRFDPGRPFRQDGETVLPEQSTIRSLAMKMEQDGVAQIAFPVNGLDIGVHHGVIKIEGADPLLIDNERHFTIEVRPPRPVLLVRPEKKSETQTEVVSRNVEVVLAPDELRNLGQAQFRVDTINQEKLLESKLSDYEAIFLLDPRPVSESQWKSLEKFVTSGGGLAIALGENAKDGFGVAKEFLSQTAVDLIGFEIRDAWTPDLTFLSIRDYNHPIFQKFKPFETDDVWRDFGVYQHWGVSIKADPTRIATLAQFSTQKPAILEHRLGAGRVISVMTPISEPGQVVGRRRWNDLTTGEWWPTALMIDETAKYLVASRNSRLNYRVGEIAVLQDQDKRVDEYLMFPPRNEDPTEMEVEDGELRYRFTDSIGSYRLKPIGDPALRKGFSVNLDKRDTDLELVDDAFWESLLGEARFKIARNKEEIIREQSYVREGKKFFPLLITFVAIIVIMELLIANRFYRGL